MGWKTILAGVMWGLSEPFKQAPTDVLQFVGQVFEVIAPMLGALGVSHKFVKAKTGG